MKLWHYRQKRTDTYSRTFSNAGTEQLHYPQRENAGKRQISVHKKARCQEAPQRAKTIKLCRQQERFKAAEAEHFVTGQVHLGNRTGKSILQKKIKRVKIESMRKQEIVEYFEEVETNREYNGYFYSIPEAISIVVLGSICGLRNISQIHQWAESDSVSGFLKEKFGIEHIPCYYWLLSLLNWSNRNR